MSAELLVPRTGEMALHDGSLSAADAAVCRQLLVQGSRSFHAASLLLPRRMRLPAAAVYALCRVADDAVDEADPAQGGAGEALRVLRRRLDRIAAGDPLDQPVDRSFSAVSHAFGIPRALPQALLEGFAWDVDARRYADIGQVRAYGVRVASSVGLMMTCLMQPRDPRFTRTQVFARAADLGVAMQLTNIARDVGEDAANGRLYLPRDWMVEAGIDPDAWLAAPVFSPALGTVVQRLLDEAERLYRRAEAGIAMLPWDCRVAITAALRIYEDIGRVIAGRGYDSVSGRAWTSQPRKLVLALSSLPALLPRAPDPDLARAEPLPEAAALVDAVARMASG